MPDPDATPPAIPPLVREKLAAFDRMARAFQAGFAYVEQMHGQRRFSRVPVSATVRYLHSLWLCDRKDALLSVPQTRPRYDQRRALNLLLAWQEGDIASVVAFLEHKLDMLPFAQLTRHLQEAQQEAQQRQPAAEDAAVVDRLRHGRAILINRGLNLHHALEAIFALPADQLAAEVRIACARRGHAPERIREQQEVLDTPLYSYRKHPALARRNMLAMNRAGVDGADSPPDRPGGRTARVSPAGRPLPAYADVPLAHQIAFTPPPYSTLPYSPTPRFTSTDTSPAIEGA